MPRISVLAGEQPRVGFVVRQPEPDVFGDDLEQAVRCRDIELAAVLRRIAASARRRRGSVMFSVGSAPRTLSRVAARNTARTFMNRVLIVDGCNGRFCMAFTHDSTFDGRRSPSAKLLNVTLFAARRWK